MALPIYEPQYLLSPVQHQRGAVTKYGYQVSTMTITERTPEHNLSSISKTNLCRFDFFLLTRFLLIILISALWVICPYAPTTARDVYLHGYIDIASRRYLGRDLERVLLSPVHWILKKNDLDVELRGRCQEYGGDMVVDA